jgi:phosphomevalonate kinase
MNKICVSKPGKLYFMGEYGVVSGKSHAIIFPTTWKLQVSIEESHEFLIESSQWTSAIHYDLHHLEDISNLSKWERILLFMKRYAKELGLQIPTHHILIQSELDQSIHHKWGLGSSGAFSVAMIDALSRLLGIPQSPLSLYKLAVLSQLQDMDHTSFGDIACSAFETPILYKMVDREWLKGHLLTPISTMLTIKWPNLVIEPISFSPIPLMVVHTSISADSYSLVKKAFESIPRDFLDSLMKSIDDITLEALKALQCNDLVALDTCISSHHQIYQVIDSFTKGSILPAILLELFKEASQYGISGKCSGAGGGDNVLFLTPNNESIQPFINHIASKYTIITSHIIGVIS